MVASEEYLLEVIQETGLVMPGDIAKATAQKQGREGVIDTLVRLNIITPEDVTRSLAYQANMDFVDLREFKPSQEAVDLVPADVAQRYKLAPIKIEGGSLMIAVNDPLDFETLDSWISYFDEKCTALQSPASIPDPHPRPPPRPRHRPQPTPRP